MATRWRKAHRETNIMLLVMHHQHRLEQISSFTVLSMTLARLIDVVSVYLRHRLNFVLANQRAHRPSLYLHQWVSGGWCLLCH